MSDPTREEMLAFLKAQPFANEASDFDFEGAIYWFANDYHEGQSSNLYQALCNSPFSPGPICTGPEPYTMEADFYMALEEEFAE